MGERGRQGEQGENLLLARDSQLVNFDYLTLLGSNLLVLPQLYPVEAKNPPLAELPNQIHYSCISNKR